MQIQGAEPVRQLVLDNQVMLGSVNAAHGHFHMGADDLFPAHPRWGGHIAALITNQARPSALRLKLGGLSLGPTD